MMLYDLSGIVAVTEHAKDKGDFIVQNIWSVKNDLIIVMWYK